MKRSPALLDEVATVEGCDGVLLTFDDFIKRRRKISARASSR